MARFSSLALLAAAIALANNGAWAASVQGLSPRAAAEFAVKRPNGGTYSFSSDLSKGAASMDMTGPSIGVVTEMNNDFDASDDSSSSTAESTHTAHPHKNKTETPTATHAASYTPTMTPTDESETIHSDENMNVGTFNTKPGQSVTFD